LKLVERQDSQPVFSGAKLLILLTQKTAFAPQMYSELAQFFKLVSGFFSESLKPVAEPAAWLSAQPPHPGFFQFCISMGTQSP
jgi:hypothetical protein